MRTQNRIIVIVILLLLYAEICHAQCIGNINNITTNPNVPVNSQIPSKRNTFFDWRQTAFTVNNPRFGTGLYSPFYQSDNVVINHFLYNLDYSPSDGWELLKYDFGFNDDGSVKPQITSTVYLALYNKFTSILRVFFAADHNDGYNGASVEVNVNGASVPSLLQDANDFSAIDNFKAIKLSSPSEFLNNVGKWLYADFYLSYDPCTCQSNSKLTIRPWLIKSSKISLKGKLEGTITSIENNQGSVNSDQFSFSNLDPSNPKKAYNTFKDASAFANKAVSIAGQNTAIKNAINQFTDELKSVKFIKDGLKAVPFISTAFELFDLFTGGGKDAGPQEVKIMPMAIAADIGLNGTLETKDSFGSITMATPGTMTSTNYMASEYPYYNEVLGVFGLLATPTYSSFALGTRQKLDKGWDYTNYTQGFKISNQIRYAVNPAAGLDVQEIQAQVVIKVTRPNKLDSTVRISPMLPISSIGGYAFASSSGGVNIPPSVNFNTVNNRVFLKLFINLRRKIGGANSQNVLHVVTYPVLATSPSTFTGWVDQFDNSYKNAEYTSLLSYPQNLTIGTSQTLTANKGAISDVTIAPASVAQSRWVRDKDGRYYWQTYYVPGPPITVTSSNGSQILAGNSISVGGGVTLTTGLTLRTISGERNDNIYPQSNTVISSFCNSSSYLVPARNLQSASHEEEDNHTNDDENNYQLTSFPSPSTGIVTFEYKLDEPCYVKLYLTNLMGEKIIDLVDSYQEAGQHDVNYDGTSLKSGVYLYSLIANKGKEIKRLVVIK